MGSDASYDRSPVEGSCGFALRLDRQRAFPDGAVELIHSLEEKENRNAA